ncbi:hypothetical protein HEMROJRC1_18070 [Rodentibacter sp. JRC1]|nr:zinc transporter binding subunit ZevA [Rodentibacter sp. JRC1]GJI56695.1 hypothetical protein HEMROJRC1_18070 [Rodentibacter sp. JRC1]
MRKFFLLFLAWIPQVMAHPHAFIDMKIKLLVNEEKLTGFRMQWRLDEASSSEMLYDLALAEGDATAKQRLVDDVMKNVVAEHYFSYFFDKNNKKIKYKSTPKNYGMHAQGTYLEYYFDVLLASPQKLAANQFMLMTYDKTYYVAMLYPEPVRQSVDFSALPANCQGKLIEPNIDEKWRSYAMSLDKSQRDTDNSLGAMFAQTIKIQCE